MRLGVLLLAVLLALVVAAAAAAAADAAKRRVPQGWLGVTVDGPLAPELVGQWDRRVGEWDRMVAAGVESVRASVRWSNIQPYPNAVAVPHEEAARFHDMGGVPTDFSRTDALVEVAAHRRLMILPVIESTPSWAAVRRNDFASPPRDMATVRRFVTALARRYAPGGSFWRERPGIPRVPIRAWQIWNEPNLSAYWSQQPFGRSYVRLLRVAGRAIRSVDAGATVVLAGLPNRSWEALREIYAAGGRGHFDAVALHPYTKRPADVMRIIRRVRAVMRARGDRRTAVWITEFSWPASRRQVPRPRSIETTDAGQARKLRQALRQFAGARRRARIDGVFWYTWLSRAKGPSGWDWAGLRRLRAGSAVATPALTAFRRAARRLQGCAKAPGNAQRCSR